MGAIDKFLKKCDVNPSTEDSFKVRTIGGAIISIITVSLMTILFWGELRMYTHIDIAEDMVIDKETTDETVIAISVDFPYIPCTLLQVGYKDALGNDRTDIDNEILKTNLDVNGNLIGFTDKSTIAVTAPTKEEVLENTKHTDDPNVTEAPKECGECYGAGEEGQCCNTCEDVIQAYRNKKWDVERVIHTAKQCKGYSFLNNWKNGIEKGCRIEGHMKVTKVQGHMYIVPSRVNELLTLNEIREILNVTHTIHKFSLGTDLVGHTSPFKERVGYMTTERSSMYQYFVNAIPTTYIDIKGNETKTYQVTETHHIRPLQEGSALMPGVYFVYEFSPLRSVIRETHLPFFELCTSLCAILGGVFTVMGMIDSLVYAILRKVQSRSMSTESELTQRVIAKND